MAFPDSQKFRTEIEQALKAHPSLSKLEVVDGHVPPGTLSWAECIRDRIRGSKVVIGDVTGMRPEVLFEMGFAFGLRKVSIPVAANKAEFKRLPEWLTASQLGTFLDQAGIQGIVAAVATHLGDPSYAVQKKLSPIPELVIWVRDLQWNAETFERCRRVMEAESLHYEHLPGPGFSENNALRIAKSSLLVVSLDGTEDDAFVHYVCGAILAKPKSGYGKQLKRRVLILVRPGLKTRSVLAEGVSRCADRVKIVTDDNIAAEVKTFCQSYRKWIGGSAAGHGAKDATRRKRTP